MRNTGQTPDTAGASIDIEFRNGKVRRNTTADKWRWKPWDDGQSDWDIVRWQYSSTTQRKQERAA